MSESHTATEQPDQENDSSEAKNPTGPSNAKETEETASGGYVIPSFLDILLQSEFRILHQEPPLRHQETQADREVVNCLLQQYWNPTDSRTLLNQYQEDVGKEFTYGEVTSIGVRQLLLEDMELLECGVDWNNNDSHNHDTITTNPIVFYDLGSGEGKLVVQVLLEIILPKVQQEHQQQNQKNNHHLPKHRVVGIELSPARHAMAVQSWNKLQDDLLQGNIMNMLPTKEQSDNSNHNDRKSGNEGDSRNAEKQMSTEANNSSTNKETIPTQEQHDLLLAKQKLCQRVQQLTCDKNSTQPPSLQPYYLELIHGNLMDYDFSDATHIFASSIFFPPVVLETMCHKINEYAKQFQKLQVIAALSDLELLEENDSSCGYCLWEKHVQRLQMSWGGANVRVYKRKDYD